MKYEVGAKKRLEESGNSEKEISKNAKLGKSDLDVQIAQLKAEIVKAESKEEFAQEKHTDSKYATPFNLENIDEAEFELKKASKQVAKFKEDLKSREALKKELF